jgi:hypothetical protein
MTANDFSSLEFLAKCSGWSEPPLDRSGKIDPRFMGTINYLLVKGFAESLKAGGAQLYKITASGRETLERRAEHIG